VLQRARTDAQLEIGILNSWRRRASTWCDRSASPWKHGDYSSIEWADPDIEYERVLVLTHSTGRGKASGMEISDKWTKAACLFHVRGGRVTRLVVYIERERALADLGLAPEVASPPS
jgi:hypothetical protein